MADKVNLVEIDINVTKVLEDTRALKITLDQLKESANKVKETSGVLSNEYIELQGAMKLTSQEIRTNENLTKNLITVENAATGSIEQQRAKLAAVTVQWNRMSEEERKNTAQGKALTAQKTQLTESLKKETMATGDARMNVGNYTKSIQEAFGITSEFVPVIGQFSAGAGMIGKAFTAALGPIGVVIGLIALVVTALKAFFTQSEEGQNAWSRIWIQVKTVLNNIMDLLADLGEMIMRPGQAIDAMGKLWKATFGNIIGGVIEGVIARVKLIGSEVNFLFQKIKDVFTENSNGVKNAQKDIANNMDNINAADKRLSDGLSNTVDAFEAAINKAKEFIQVLKYRADMSAKIADIEAQLDERSRKILIQNAQLSLSTAELRNKIAQKETYTNKERIKFIDEAMAKEKQIMANNLIIAQQQFEIAKAKAALGKNDKETNDELARLEAEIYHVREANFMKTKELEAQRVEAIRANAITEKAIRDKLAKENADRLKQEALNRLADFDQELEAYRQTELEKVSTTQERINLESEVEQATLKQRYDKNLISEADYQTKLTEIRSKAFDEYSKVDAQRREIESTAAYDAAKNNILLTLDLQRQELQMKHDQEIEFAKSIGADTVNIEKKYSNAKIELHRAEQEAKMDLASGFFQNIATIAGEGTRIAKVAAVAETTINTYKAATGAYSALAGIPVVGPALGIAAAAAAVVAGLANVKKILEVKTDLPGASSGGSSSVSQPQTPRPTTSIVPTLNQGIVSRQEITNNQQNQQVNQPILVVDDVTSKQNYQNSNVKTGVL